MPRFLEQKLKAEYPGNPSAVYGTLNKLGYMHGNVETAAGKAAERKHSAKMRGSMAHAKKHPSKNLGAHLHPKKGRS